MTVYVYSDESGVFDYIHNEYYVYGGLILTNKKDKDNLIRKYKEAEKNIRKTNIYKEEEELKATILKPQHKRTLFKLMNNCYVFGVIIEQSKINKNIFNEKKSKQRYLDYAYKIGLKNALKKLVEGGVISSADDINFIINTDEHTTATNGCYELKEGLLQEFKEGTFNWNYNKHYPPLFPNTKSLEVKYLNSAKIPLIRAADIIANRILFENNRNNNLRNINHVIIKYLP